MKEIVLTKGKVAFVDDEDYADLAKRRWYASKNYRNRTKEKFYAQTWPGVSMHRLILSAPKEMQVDHIDGNGLNNQKSNLRLCTKSQNGANQGPTRLNKSGYRGVCWNRKSRGWQASLVKDGRQIHVGTFPTAELAARAYDLKARELHGEFARLNFPAVICG